MYISIACFSELIDIIQDILTLTGDRRVPDDEVINALERKAIDFITFAAEPV